MSNETTTLPPEDQSILKFAPATYEDLSDETTLLDKQVEETERLLRDAGELTAEARETLDHQRAFGRSLVREFYDNTDYYKGQSREKRDLRARQAWRCDRQAVQLSALRTGILSMIKKS